MDAVERELVGFSEMNMAGTKQTSMMRESWCGSET